MVGKVLIPRTIAPKGIQYTTQYPVVTTTGPNHSGKTNLCKLTDFSNESETRLTECYHNTFKGIDICMVVGYQ
jgi:hypothetical protein